MKKYAIIILLCLFISFSAYAKNDTLHFPFEISYEDSLSKVAANLERNMDIILEPQIYSFLDSWDQYFADTSAALFGCPLASVYITLTDKLPKEAASEASPEEWESIDFKFALSDFVLKDYYTIRDGLISLYGSADKEMVWNSISTFEGSQTKKYKMPASWTTIWSTFDDNDYYGLESNWKNVKLYYQHSDISDTYSFLYVTFYHNIESDV